jgi:hypothetical protein
MDRQLIITHPGSAHFDEVTAVSLILAVHADIEFRIERRQPAQTELDDPGVWVVDTGGRYEAGKLNFDHHQSLDCPAAFVIVADHLGLLETLCVLPWWRFKDSVDRFGPVRASRQYGAGDDLVNRNPVEDWLVARFAAEPQAVLSLLKSYGTQMIEYAQRLRRQIDFWRASRRVVIAGVPALIGETRESLGLEEFRKLEKSPPDIIISLDSLSQGWRLFRYEGVAVDFTRISNCPEIAFVHKTGFLAKTKDRLPVEELLTLVSLAVTEL